MQEVQYEKRSFAIDVLACPHCGGRLRLIATLHDPAVIRKLLAHLALSRSGPSPGPAAARALIGLCEGAMDAVVPARGVIRAGPARPSTALTAAVCRHSMPLNRADAVGARGGC